MEDLNDKVLGSNLAATEWNQVPSELQNPIEQTGQTLTNADLNQLGKAIASYVANGNFYIDSGIADAYVLTSIGAKQSIFDYENGVAAEFIAGNTNAGASTVNIAAKGVKSIVNLAGGALVGGEIIAGTRVLLKYRDGTDDFIIDTVAQEFSITGGNILAPHEALVCKYVTDSTVDIDAGAVLLKTADNVKHRVESVNLTLDISGTGANGRDIVENSGSEKASDWYFLWVIYNGSTVASFATLASTFPSDLPSGYTFAGLVAAVFNDAGLLFRRFHQEGNSVSIQPLIALVDGSALSLTSVDLSIAIPNNVKSCSGFLTTSDTLSGEGLIRVWPDSTGLIGLSRHRSNSGSPDEEEAAFTTIIITPQIIFYEMGTDASERGDITITSYNY